MACIAPLEPEKLKNHTLGGMAITCNQRMRLLLLQRDTEQAATCLESLRTIADTAMGRAPALGRSTRECVRLYENWLSVLNGQPSDEDYLVEEVRLSKNRIHKSEIELLLLSFMLPLTNSMHKLTNGNILVNTRICRYAIMVKTDRRFIHG